MGEFDPGGYVQMGFMSGHPVDRALNVIHCATAWLATAYGTLQVGGLSRAGSTDQDAETHARNMQETLLLQVVLGLGRCQRRFCAPGVYRLAGTCRLFVFSAPRKSV